MSVSISLYLALSPSPYFPNSLTYDHHHSIPVTLAWAWDLQVQHMEKGGLIDI